MENPYFKNASFFLNIAKNNIKQDINLMQREELIASVLFFAIGIENILKGILHNVNPIFVYENANFSNMVNVLYKDKIFDKDEINRTGTKDKEHSVNKETKDSSNTLTFTSSLSRAKYFSAVTFGNQNVLYTLSDDRGIIVHCLLNELTDEKLKKVIGNFKPLIYKYQVELEYNFIDITDIEISEINQRDIEFETIVSKKLENFQLEWESKKSDSEHIKWARINTINNSMYHTDYYECVNIIECPACKQHGLLYFYGDYEETDYHGNPIQNLIPASFSCHFCGFSPDDKEMDYLKLSDKESKEIDWDSDGNLTTTKNANT